MSNNNTFSPIEHATPISDLKKRLEKRKTIDEQNPGLGEVVSWKLS